MNWINESLTRIKKMKNNDKGNNSRRSGKDGEHIITDNKSNNLENIKKKWKDLQEKNNINNK